MKTKILVTSIILVLLFVACQTTAPTSVPSISTPPEQMETSVAATIYANQTSTTQAEFAQHETLTAAVPSPTNTPAATPTEGRIHFVLPADACWLNSEVNVQTGQTVLIRALGTASTWDGREGSSADPKGQPNNMCGAIECPLQGANYGALIGRIGDGKAFLVGAGVKFVAEGEGQLSFTINDWKCSDNSGYFDILISFP